MSGIVVANAPISYGAFELTVGVNPNVPDPAELLEFVANAGFDGIDLGPIGYLGTDTELRDRLGAHGIGLAGGFLELPFDDPDALTAGLPALDALLDVFDAVDDDWPAPRPTLGDAGSDARRAHAGRVVDDRTLGWDEPRWRRFGDGIARAVQRCRERGYEPAFHPEAGTNVEAEWEIQRLLEVSDIGLCLDTGHLLAAGADPLRCTEQWLERINHLHLKDARLDVLRAITAEGAPSDAIWRRRAFCPLGAGDVPVDAVLTRLRDHGYTGWLVVEQDIMPEPSDLPGQAAEEQVANRRYLTARGL